MELFNIFYFVTINFLGLFISYTFSAPALDRNDRLSLLFCTLCVFPCVVLLCLISLGTVGLLSPVPVITMLGAVLAGILVLQRKLLIEKLRKKRPPLGSLLGNRRQRLLCLAILSAAAGIGYLIGAVLPGTFFTHDDMSYHAVTSAHWLMDGTITVRPLAYQQVYYPFNGDLFSIWWMLPFGTDAFVGFSNLYWISLLVVTALVFGRHLGLTALQKAFVIVTILGSAIVKGRIKNFGCTDLAAPTTILASAVLLFTVTRRPAEEFRSRIELIAGLVSGFAVGSKPTFLPPVIVLFAIYLFSIRRSSATSLFRRLLLLIGGLILTGTYWYIRNFAITQNPVYPVDNFLFDGPFSADYLAKSSVFHKLFREASCINPTNVLRDHLNWPLFYLLIPFSGYISTAYLLLRKRDRLFTSGKSSLALSAIGLSFLCVYLFSPFSGSNNMTLCVYRISLRFLILPVLCGCLLFAESWASVRQTKLWGLIVIAGVLILWSPLSTHNFKTNSLINGAMLVGVTGVGLLAVRFSNLIKRLIRHPISVWPLVLLFLLGLGLNHDTLQRKARRNMYKTSKRIGMISPAVIKEIETLPRRSTITWIGPGVYYPLMGTGYHQMNVTKVSPQGTKHQFLHERSVSSQERISAPSLGYIRESVDYIVWEKQAAGPHSPWHPLVEAISASPTFTTVHEDDMSLLWKNELRTSSIR